MAKSLLRTFSGEEYRFGGQKLAIECFRCGICCEGYYPQLDDDEIERIAPNLDMTKDKFISEYCRITTIGYLLRQTKSGCVFLEWEEGNDRNRRALCRIHSFRPDACRNWEPSLLRRECKEGLARVQKGKGLMLPGEVYRDPEEIKKFCEGLKGE
jgi:uncharacterized protein